MKSYFIAVLYFSITVFSSFTANAQTNVDIKYIPDLELKLNNNETVKLRELKGKVVLLDFWFRGCFPCVKSIPGLIELQEEFKDNLVIIGVNHEDVQEDVNEYIEYKKMNYLSTYKTEDKTFKDFGVNSFPTVIIYDREGKLIKIEKGYHEGGVDSLRKAIKKALK